MNSCLVRVQASLTKASCSARIKALCKAFKPRFVWALARLDPRSVVATPKEVPNSQRRVEILEINRRFLS